MDEIHTSRLTLIPLKPRRLKLYLDNPSALEKEIGRLHDILAAPDLYARDPKKFADASAKLEAAQKDLSESEERWLELEMLREELER